MGLLDKVFGTHSERELKRVYPIVDQIEALEPTMEKLSDEELKNKTTEFKNRLKNGETLQQNRIQTRLAGSPGDTMNVYVIRVPKGTPSQDINPENIHGVKAKYVLYVWTR